jgi:hypothetical protein
MMPQAQVRGCPEARGSGACGKGPRPWPARDRGTRRSGGRGRTRPSARPRRRGSPAWPWGRRSNEKASPCGPHIEIGLTTKGALPPGRPQMARPPSVPEPQRTALGRVRRCGRSPGWLSSRTVPKFGTRGVTGPQRPRVAHFSDPGTHPPPSAVPGLGRGGCSRWSARAAHPPSAGGGSRHPRCGWRGRARAESRARPPRP